MEWVKNAGFQLISTGKPKECKTFCLYFQIEICLSGLLSATVKREVR